MYQEPAETLRPGSEMELDTGWVAGFVDGEGRFNLGINPHPETTAGFQVLPEFNIAQHERDDQVLHALKSYLECGVVRKITETGRLTGSEATTTSSRQSSHSS